jgi:hypothetical protein
MQLAAPGGCVTVTLTTVRRREKIVRPSEARAVPLPLNWTISVNDERQGRMVEK